MSKSSTIINKKKNKRLKANRLKIVIDEPKTLVTWDLSSFEIETIEFTECVIPKLSWARYCMTKFINPQTPK